MATAADERRHEPGPGESPLWAEEWSFWFHAADAALAGWVSLSLHPGLGLARYRSGLWQAGEPLVAVSDDSIQLPRAPGLEIRSQGLWADHICETPLDHWTVTNETHALGVADPEALADPEARGDIVPLAIDLEWEDAGSTVACGPAGGVSGYVRDCSVSGEILVGRDAIDLAPTAGGRDHRWGLARGGGSRGTVATGAGLGLLVDLGPEALDGLAQGRPVTAGGARLEPLVSVPDRGGFWPGAGRRALCRVSEPALPPGSAWVEWWQPA